VRLRKKRSGTKRSDCDLHGMKSVLKSRKSWGTEEAPRTNHNHGKKGIGKKGGLRLGTLQRKKSPFIEEGETLNRPTKKKVDGTLVALLGKTLRLKTRRLGVLQR